MATEPADVMTERLVALGLVSEASATLESTLRSAFCSLVGSKYAAIVAGGQPVSFLLDQCGALTKAHLEILPEHKDAIQAALSRCRAAMDQRNTLIHAVKSSSRATDGVFRTMRSRKGTNMVATQQWTPAEIGEVAAELVHADLALFGAIQAAVSPEVMVIDHALAWEKARGQAEPS